MKKKNYSGPISFLPYQKTLVREINKLYSFTNVLNCNDRDLTLNMFEPKRRMNCRERIWQRSCRNRCPLFMHYSHSCIIPDTKRRRLTVLPAPQFGQPCISVSRKLTVSDTSITGAALSSQRNSSYHSKHKTVGVNWYYWRRNVA